MLATGMAVQAQNVVSGHVTITDDGPPVAIAKVSDCKGGVQVWTKEDGYYEIRTRQPLSCVSAQVVDDLYVFELQAQMDSSTVTSTVDFFVPTKPSEYVQLDQKPGEINPKTLTTITGEMTGGYAVRNDGSYLDTFQKLWILDDALIWGSVTSRISDAPVMLRSLPDGQVAYANESGHFEITTKPGPIVLQAIQGTDTLSVAVDMLVGLNRVTITIE